MNEKEIIEDFLKWCFISRSVQLQEMPEYTTDYWGVDSDEMIDNYLENLINISLENLKCQ